MNIDTVFARNKVDKKPSAVFRCDLDLVMASEMTRNSV